MKDDTNDTNPENDPSAMEPSPDTPLYGPRKILCSGFSPEEQPSLLNLFTEFGLTNVPLVWVTSDQGEDIVSDLMTKPDKTGWMQPSSLEKTIIFAGITMSELNTFLMNAKEAGMKETLLAVLTPNSEVWSMNYLISHLEEEREEFRAQQSADT